MKKLQICLISIACFFGLDARIKYKNTHPGPRYKVYVELTGCRYRYTTTAPPLSMICKVHFGTACTISATVSASYFNINNSVVFPTTRTPHVTALYGLDKIYG